MKLSMTLKAAALIVAAGAFGFVSSAKADDDAKDAIFGIIGEVIAGAAEAEEEAVLGDPRCAAWESKCDSGQDWACRKADDFCGDD